MRSLVVLMSCLLVACLSLVAMPCFAQGGHFDEFGYNYTARVFVGPLDGADRNLDGTYWGDPTYAKDRLVMKWSKGWDRARFHGGAWGPDCWVSNEFNGRWPGGTRWMEHVMIVWVGPELQASVYWRPGGAPIWGQFEVIMDHALSPDNEHQWWVGPVAPAGYGARR